MNRLTDPVILIVDPDPISASGTGAVLQYQNYDVHVAETPAGALRIVRAILPDLLICDEQVDARSGLNCVEAIHRLPECRDVPVMFISRHQRAGVIRRRHAFGAAYHLKKPLDAVTLIELIDRVLWLPMTQTPLADPHFRPAVDGSGATRSADERARMPVPYALHSPTLSIGNPGPAMVVPATLSPPPVV